MSAPELHWLAQVFTERMLNAAAEGMILAGLAWALLRLIGRQSSRTRFAVWFGTLLTIVALPFFARWALCRPSADDCFRQGASGNRPLRMRGPTICLLPGPSAPRSCCSG